MSIFMAPPYPYEIRLNLTSVDAFFNSAKQHQKICLKGRSHLPIIMPQRMMAMRYLEASCKLVKNLETSLKFYWIGRILSLQEILVHLSQQIQLKLS